MPNRLHIRPLTIVLVSLFLAVTTAAGEITSVFDMAQPRDLPPGAPKYSDVCMRNLRVYSADKKDPYDTIRLIKDFHVTRMDWTYQLTREFVKEANDLGVSVQGTVGSLLRRDKLGESTSPKDIGIENLNGGEVIAHWMRTESWKRVLWGCVNKPAYRKSRLEVQKGLLDLGVERLHVDDPAMNRVAVTWGACFCDHCMERFREFLSKHTTAAQREELGIKNIDSFNYREHLREAEAPVGDGFHFWDGGELKRLFQAFQTECTIEFHRWNREQLDQYAGHRVAFSCNNSVHGFEDEAGVFDYALGELWYRDARPRHIYDAAMEAASMGKLQMLTMPKPYYHESTPEWERLTRQSMAMAYACGANTLLPFDVYIPIPSLIRYYGTKEQYGDLCGFVRGMAEYLDGFELAYAGGRTISDARWAGKPGPVRVSADRREMVAIVRARPGRRDKAVIHLVDWSKQPQPFRLAIDPTSFYGGNRKVRWRLLVPAVYDQTAHEQAQASGDFSELVAEAASGVGVVSELSLPALHPWGIVVLESAGEVDGHLWEPTVLGASRFVDETQVSIRCATPGAKIRYTTDGSDPDRESTIYTEPLTLHESTLVKARAFEGDEASEVRKARFVREESRRNILQNGDFDEGMSGWELVNRTNEEAAMKGAVTLREDGKGKAMRIKIQKPSDTMRDLQLVQDSAARDGGYYDLRFSARAEEPITILVKLQEPSRPFRTLRAISCELDREWKEFSVLGYNTDRKREASWSKSMSCRIQFDLGRVSAGNVVWLDDVQLEEDWLE